MLKGKIYFSLYYDWAKKYYRVISKRDSMEIYCSDNKVFIAIKDEEIGKRLYEVMNGMQNIEMNYFGVSFKINRFFYNKQKVKYICLYKIRYSDWYIPNWERYSDYIKLLNSMFFIENMRDLGFYLDIEKMQDSKFDCQDDKFDCMFDWLIEFLSFFSKNDENEQKSKEFMIKKIHNVLSNGLDFEEFYKKLESKAIVESKVFPYSIHIAKMCYEFYKNGEIPTNISEILMYVKPNDNKLILLNESLLNVKHMEIKQDYEALICELNVKRTEIKQHYKILMCEVYRKNLLGIKIYHNLSNWHVNIWHNLINLIDEHLCNDLLFEQIEDEIVDLDNKFVGYTFHQGMYEANTISGKKMNSQKEIIDLVERISKFFEYEKFYNFYHIEGKFDIEKAFVIVKTDENEEVKLRTLEDLAGIFDHDKQCLREETTRVFFKLLLDYIDSKKKLSSRKQFLEKEEIRMLPPIVAREVVNYALNKDVNYEIATIEFFDFLSNKKIAHKKTSDSDKNLYYDSNFERNPLEKPFLFENEAKKKYNIQNLKKGLEMTVSEGKRLVVFKRSKNHIFSEYVNSKKTLIEDIEESEYLKFVEISEVIYSKELNVEGFYKTIGYVTEPIKGKTLTMEFLLGLNNRDLYKIVGSLFEKASAPLIPWETIRVDENMVYYIDILNKEFILKNKSSRQKLVYGNDYIISIFEELVNQGYNQYAFVDFYECYSKSKSMDFIGLSKRMNAYCNEHKIYYDEQQGQCPACAKTKFLIGKNFKEGRIPEMVFEDDIARHYRIDENYGLKIYKDSIRNMEIIEKNVDKIVSNKLLDITYLHQDCFIPCKKAVNKDGKFLGYVYETAKFVNDEGKNVVKDIENLINLPKLKSLVRLLCQVEDIIGCNYGFIENPFSHVYLNLNCKLQVQIVNIDMLDKGENLSETKRWVCKYVCKVINADEMIPINVDVNDIDGDISQLRFQINNTLQRMTRRCVIHKIYYTEDQPCCPKCVSEYLLNKVGTYTNFKNNISVIDIDMDFCVEKTVKHKDEGGEAYIYFYEEGDVIEVAKIFKEDKINYDWKMATIMRILSKKDILDNINSKDFRYKYIYPKKLISYRGCKIIGYVMDEVKGGYPIANLRDKEITRKLGISRKDVLEMLITIGEGIETLHKEVNMVIGDLNGRNILFDKNKIVYFLDFDGMGIDEISPTCWTDEYIDPISKKNQKITMKDDWYSFAIQAFYYLTFTHPFNGVYYQKNNRRILDITKKMEMKISLLGLHGMEIPDIAESWDWMTEELKTAFLNIFEGDNRDSIVPQLKEQYDILYK